MRPVEDSFDSRILAFSHSRILTTWQIGRCLLFRMARLLHRRVVLPSLCLDTFPHHRHRIYDVVAAVDPTSPLPSYQAPSPGNLVVHAHGGPPIQGDLLRQWPSVNQVGTSEGTEGREEVPELF